MCVCVGLCAHASHASKKKKLRTSIARQNLIDLLFDMLLLVFCFIKLQNDLWAVCAWMWSSFFFFFFSLHCSRESYWTHRLSLQPQDIQIAAGRRSLCKGGLSALCVCVCARRRLCVFKKCQKRFFQVGRDEALLVWKIAEENAFCCKYIFFQPSESNLRLRISALNETNRPSKYSSEINFIKVLFFLYL